MSFRTKLIMLLLLVAVVPVALSGALSIYTSQKEMTAQIGDFQQKSASLVAQAVDSFFLDAANSLKLATKFIPFEQFPEGELTDALRIPYRQFDYVNIVALLDQQGRQLCDPAFEVSPEKDVTLKNHESVTAEEVGTFGGHIPLQAALAAEVAFGPPYLCPRTRTPRVAVAITFPVRKGQERWVLAVELSLRKVQEKVLEAAPEPGGQAYLVDALGRLIVHHEWSRLKRRESMSDLPIVAAGLRQRQAISRRFKAPDDLELAGSFAPIPTLGWGLMVQQPVDDAFAVVGRIRLFAFFWLALSLAVAIFGGIFFARGVSDPVRQLAATAREIAMGKFEQQIPVRSNDEIGQLGDAFNLMAADLQKSFNTITEQFAQIQEKNVEIQGWNEELQQRVEERTRELKEAQEQIVMSQKMAAVSELGAGVAHEINNPLTGIQGFAQLLQVDKKPGDKEHRHLQSIIKETERIRAIVSDLLRMSQAQDEKARARLSLNAVITDALRMVMSQLEERQITVSQEFACELSQMVGNYADLQQMFLHLINNSKNAMPQGGTLSLITKEVEGGAIKATIRDTGTGIDKENLSRIFEPFYTTKQDWSGRGLGLSVANRIVQEHEGKITVESKLGSGSSFNIIFPGVRKQLHIK